MDIETAIRTLRVVRRFEDRPLEPAHLEAILNAGRRASSSKNQQRWGFIVVTDRERLRQLAAVGDFAGHLAGAAAAVALVTPDPRGPGQPLSVLWDLGLASQNMILAAWSLGIGSCPATVYDWNAPQKKIIVSYENCIECGACRMLCPFDNIKCHWPRGGFGVQYKFG